jgi:hypothetical protein
MRVAASARIERFPLKSHSRNIRERTAHAIASYVFMNATPAMHLASSALRALKPNQPVHSSAAPIGCAASSSLEYLVTRLSTFP